MNRLLLPLRTLAHVRSHIGSTGRFSIQRRNFHGYNVARRKTTRALARRCNPTFTIHKRFHVPRRGGPVTHGYDEDDRLTYEKSKEKIIRWAKPVCFMTELTFLTTSMTFTVFTLTTGVPVEVVERCGLDNTTANLVVVSVAMMGTAGMYYTVRKFAHSYFTLLGDADRSLAPLSSRMGSRSPFPVLLLTFGLVIFLVKVVENLSETKEDPYIIYAAMEGNHLRLLWMNLVVPIAEEFMFRGVIFTAFLRCGGPVTAYFMSSLIFGLCHYSDDSKKVALTAGLGFLLAFTYHTTGRLLAPIIMHAMNNSLISLSLLAYQPFGDRTDRQQRLLTNERMSAVLHDRISKHVKQLLHWLDVKKLPPSVINSDGTLNGDFTQLCETFFESHQQNDRISGESVRNLAVVLAKSCGAEEVFRTGCELIRDRKRNAHPERVDEEINAMVEEELELYMEDVLDAIVQARVGKEGLDFQHFQDLAVFIASASPEKTARILAGSPYTLALDTTKLLMTADAPEDEEDLNNELKL